MAKKNIPYPAVLKVVWRYARVFVSVFLIQFGTGLANINSFEAGKALAISALSAGLVAIGKAIREYFKENKENIYEAAIKRIPI